MGATNCSVKPVSSCPTVLIAVDAHGAEAVKSCLSKVQQEPSGNLLGQHVLGLWQQDNMWQIWEGDWRELNTSSTSVETLISQRLLRRHSVTPPKLQLLEGILAVFVVGRLDRETPLVESVQKLRMSFPETILALRIYWFGLLQIPTELLKAQTWPAVDESLVPLLVQDDRAASLKGNGLDHCFVVSNWDYEGGWYTSEEDVPAKVMSPILIQFVLADLWDAEGFLTQRVRHRDEDPASRISALGFSQHVTDEHQGTPLVFRVASEVCRQWADPWPDTAADLRAELEMAADDVEFDLEELAYLPGLGDEEMRGLSWEDLAQRALNEITESRKDLESWRRRVQVSIEEQVAHYREHSQETVRSFLASSAGFHTVPEVIGQVERALRIAVRRTRLRLPGPRRPGQARDEIDTTLKRGENLVRQSSDTRAVAAWGLVVSLPVSLALSANSNWGLSLSLVAGIGIALSGFALSLILVFFTPNNREIRGIRSRIWSPAVDHHAELAHRFALEAKLEFLGKAAGSLGELKCQLIHLRDLPDKMARDFIREADQLTSIVEPATPIPGKQLPDPYTLSTRFMEFMGEAKFEPYLPWGYRLEELPKNLEDLMQRALRFSQMMVSEIEGGLGHLDAYPSLVDFEGLVRDLVDRAKPLVPHQLAQGGAQYPQYFLFAAPGLLDRSRDHLPQEKDVRPFLTLSSNLLAVFSVLSPIGAVQTPLQNKGPIP